MTIPTPKFKVGDRVRDVRNEQEFVVAEVSRYRPVPTLAEEYTYWYASKDEFSSGGIWEQDLEAVEPPVPPVEEYRDPRHEATLRANEDLQAVLRRRNETIASHIETIERQKAQLAEYAGEIEKLKSKTHVMVRVEGVEDLIDDLKLMQEASEALAPRSIQLTIRISDADGKVAKYGAILEDVDEDSALDSTFAARDIVENTIDQHFNGKPKVAELLNGDAA